MSLLKIIAIGDQHFQINNIQEVNIFIKNILILIDNINPDIIVCLGDLLHTHERLHTIALNMALEFLDKLRKKSKTYVLVGNHDYINNTQFLSTNHWLNPVKEWNNIEIVDNIKILDEFKICFVPYVYPGRFKEALETIVDNYKDFNLIFAHQEFYGCKMGAITSIEGDNWDIDNPFIISGHIHSRQRLQDNIYYTGSCMQHAFGESDNNIIAYIKISENNLQHNDIELNTDFRIINNFSFIPNNILKNIEINISEIDINLPRKKIVYIDIDDIDKPNNQLYDSKKEDKIKLSISGNYEEFKTLKKTKKFKELTDKGINIVFKPKKSSIDLKNKIIKETSEKDCIEFKTILYELINKDKNPYLVKVYEKIINDKEIDVKNIMFL